MKGNQTNEVITDKNIKSNNEEFKSNKQIEEMHLEFEKWDDADTKLSLSEWLYNAGYRKAEWISVEDRLPQENEKVLAINSDNEIFIATYLVHKISPSARGYTTWASGLWNGTPTHWMPLPEAPKMKGE